MAQRGPGGPVALMPAVDRENTPNGPYLAARLRERARPLGLEPRVEVQTYLVRSSHGVQVSWGPERGGTTLDCEVSDRFDAVVVPGLGTELTVEGYRAKDGTNRANGRDLILPGGQRLFLGSAGTGAPDDGKDPEEKK